MTFHTDPYSVHDFCIGYHLSVFYSCNRIKHFDYDDPKWTYQNGVFIQIAYDAAYTFGIGVVHYHGNTFVVGKFSKVMSPYDSELKSKIKKPKKGINVALYLTYKLDH